MCFVCFPILRSLNKRQYNLEAYEHERGRYTGCCHLCGVCITGRACGYSFDPIRTHGCFLSHPTRTHGDWLAVVDSLPGVGRNRDRRGSVWSARCESDVCPGSGHCHSIYIGSSCHCSCIASAGSNGTAACNADHSPHADSASHLFHVSAPDGH